MIRSCVITALLSVCLLTSLTVAQTALLERESAGSYPWNPIEGSDVLWARWQEAEAAWYAVSLDGGATAATVRRADDLVRLRYETFDPMNGEPAMAETLRLSDGDLWIVQYATRGLAPYRDLITARGGEVLWFIPGSGDLVRMDGKALARVSALPFVRWVGRYHTAYRVDAGTRERMLAGDEAPTVYNVHVTVQGPAEKAAVAAHVEALGGAVADYVSPHGYLMQVTLPPRDLLRIAARDDVLFTDPWSPETGEDLDVVRQFNGADYIESVAGYTGHGVRGEARDNGLQVSHPNLQRHPAIAHGPIPFEGFHGTGVFGICFGTGDDDAQARGIMPDAQGVFQNSGSLPDRFVATGELLQAPYHCVFQTNSTGSAQTPDYTTTSADMDFILFSHDVCVLQSQSNLGNQNSRPQAWAKNMISVGGIRHQNTLTENDDVWNGGASIGPAADGRIKPDISAFYDSTYSTDTGSGYQQFGGTSGATPITAAHLGLIHQMWADGVYGNSLVSWDVFENKPSASLAKALLLNSTTQYSFSGTGADLTRVHQGWGRPDVRKSYDRRDRLVYVDESIALGNLATTSFMLTVPAGETEFRATLVYRDPPGSPGAAMHRINDVTLRVVDPIGTVYFGNNGLLAGTTSTSGGTANLIDTVEQVIVLNPMAGAWQVDVTAAELNQDAHLATPQLDVVFGLAVSGVDGPPPPPPTNGQANSALGYFGVVDSLNANGQKPNVGTNGPFFVDLPAGDVLELSFKGPANRTFVLFHGPLGVGNGNFGPIGNLDLGLLGGIGDFSDVSLLLDGAGGTGFLDGLANVGPDGNQTLSFTLPSAFPPGSLGALQALFWDVPTAQLSFTAACEVNIQ